MRNLSISVCIVAFVVAFPAFATEEAPIGDKDQVLLDGYRLGSFTQMHQIYPSRIVHRAGQVRELKRKPKDFSALRYRYDGTEYSLSQYFERSNVTGFIVLKDGKIVFETYLQGTSELDVFASWSMAKSFTSTLLGLALEDGYIKSVDDPAINYVPDLIESAYKENSLKDLLQMSSGVEFIENYVDTHSLEAAAWFGGVINQQLPYNQTILWFDKRIAAPGSRYYYASIEPQVVGWTRQHSHPEGNT